MVAKRNMENFSFAIQDDGEDALQLREGTDISIVDDIAEGSLVRIVPIGEDAVEIRLADQDALQSGENLYVVSAGEQPGQIVFVRAEVETIGADDLEDELARIFENLNWYYRDYDLPVEFTSKYTPGMIIVERGFTDASKHRGGFAASHRYLIASPAAIDLSEDDEFDPDRGLCVIQRDAYFKVLNTIDEGKRRQTTLLHMPPSLANVLAGQEFTDFEKDLINEARGQFAELAHAPALPSQLKTETWLDRVSSPLGMSDEGDFFLE